MTRIPTAGLAFAFACAACAASAGGGLRFSRAWSSHMVLQRGEPIPFEGYGAPGRTVDITFNGASRSVPAGTNGAWRAVFPAIAKAGGAYAVTASDGTSQARLEDVTVGDVWLCTGQSNAWWPLALSGRPEREMADANDAGIRLLDVPTLGSESEVDEPPYARGWSRCTPRTARDFSALAYHFARTVRARLGDVPIGLVGSAWPGPPIRHFLPPNGGSPEYLEKSRRALFAAAADFARADALLDEAHDRFGDDARLAELAKRFAGTNGAESVSLPAEGGLEHTVLKSYRGIAAFSRRVEIPSAWLNRDLVLDLGQSSLPGVVFFNGTRIGAVKDWESPVPGDEGNLAWRFTVPAALVTGEANALTVFVGCHEELSWWGAFSGRMPIAPKDAPHESRPLAGDGWQCRRLIDVPHPTRTYGGSWGAQIAPFFRLPIRGVIFYQGEADAQSRRDCAAYLEDQARLVALLRERWQRPDLPFYCVQLANHGAAEDQTWSEIREAQRLAAERIPGFGFACSIDIGTFRNIHPPDKREQGRRLALQALRKTYGCADVVADGPRFRRLSVRGREAEVAFDGALVSTTNAVPGFDVRDGAGAWRPASSVAVEGDRVRLAAPCEIRGVRYLWRNFPNPPAALFGPTGLPVAPFRAEADDKQDNDSQQKGKT